MMLETVNKQLKGKLILILFLIYSGIWLSLQFPFTRDNSFIHEFFGSTYGIIALLGGIWGVQTARSWGLTKSIMGKALLFLSLGLLAQEFGQIAYFYYVFVLHIEVPYPSIGDIGYFGSIPLYILGVFYLAKASYVSIKLKSFSHKLQAVIIPFVLLMAGYLLFLQDYSFDWSNPLTVFLDFGYPLGEAIYISLAFLTYLLSRNILGGIMRSRILFIIFALLVQFISDYTFLYQTSRGTWQAGGINEYMYLLSYFLMTLALLQLNTVLVKLKEKH